MILNNKLFTSLLFSGIYLISFFGKIQAYPQTRNLDVPFKTAISNAKITQNNNLTDPVQQSLLIGNGDINGIVYVENNELLIRIHKNDVWDARLEMEHDPPLAKIDVKKHRIISAPSVQPHSWEKTPYPSPRTCAKIVIGMPGSTMSTLNIENAVAHIGNSEVSIRALVNKNVFLIETAKPVQLKAIPGLYPKGFWNNSWDFPYSLPESVMGNEDGIEWLTQEIPGDVDWEGMSFAVALAKNGNNKVVSIVSSFDSDTPKKDAIAAVKEIFESDTEELITQHEEIWREFWSASGIELSDKFLEQTWYRNLYFLRCVSKPGVNCIGIHAGNNTESPAWHGDHTLNYNTEQAFWGAAVCNHVELMEPYVSYIKKYLPRAKWFADKTYKLEGAHYPHNIVPFEPSKPEECKAKNNRMTAAFPYAYTIGVSGHIIHNLWLSYKYQPDLDYLEKTVYPVIKEVAKFYTGFLDQCSGGGKKRFGPSYSPEHGSFGSDNVAYDIAFARLTLNSAIEAAETLDVDEDMVIQFKKALEQLPDYPTLGTSANKIVVDRLGASPGVYNIPVPTTPVFPAEQVSWFSEDKEKELFARTLNNIATNGNNSMIMLSVAHARMSSENAKGKIKDMLRVRTHMNGTLGLNQVNSGFNRSGIYTEQFAASGAIAETLVQSVHNIIRIFPAWPLQEDASFENLRTQGGFLVSSSLKSGAINKVEIQSTVGDSLHFYSPWEEVSVSLNGQFVKKLKLNAQNRIVSLQSITGDIYNFTGEKLFEKRDNVDIEGVYLKTYPNPTFDFLKCDFGFPVNSRVKISLFDMRGVKLQEVLEESFTPGNYHYDLNISHFNSGIYFCKMEVGKNSYINKVVIQP